MFSAPLALVFAYLWAHPVVAAVGVVAFALIIDDVIAQDAAQGAPSPSPVAVAAKSAPAQPERPQAPAWPSTLQRQRVRARVSALNCWRAWVGPRPWNATPGLSPRPRRSARRLNPAPHPSESLMRSRHQSPYPAVTLAIFAALALLLLFTGCGPAKGPYLHTGLDSADTGEPEPVDNAFTFVEGLPYECPSVRPYIKLPQDENGEAITRFSEAEVNLAVRGDADYSGPPVTLYPVVYVADRWLVSGWWAYDQNGPNGGGVYQIRHGEIGENYGDDGGPLEPFTLACG